MNSSFLFTRLENGRKDRSSSLTDILKIREPGQQRWLCVAAHDDDIVGGAAMWLQAAVQAGIRVEILVTSDGRMGYCTAEQRDHIVEIRRKETIDSFAILGIGREQIQYIDFPDGGLCNFQGRRVAQPGEPAIAGFTGLQNAYTWHLRRVRPTALLTVNPVDLHPDHQISCRELMISVFHAIGVIWPELGEPIEHLPTVYETTTYSNFVEPPNLELRADPAALETKLRCIAAYRSQAQIENFIQRIRNGGPYEYMREYHFPLYSPSHYRSLFE